MGAGSAEQREEALRRSRDTRNVLLRPSGDLPVGRVLDMRVESRLQKYFASPVGSDFCLSSR
jgi:hypothetical protein